MHAHLREGQCMRKVTEVRSPVSALLWRVHFVEDFLPAESII
jgi:hypothetical protein